MNIIIRLISASGSLNPVTVRERERFSQTMPGQVGAIAASRHGIFV